MGILGNFLRHNKQTIALFNYNLRIQETTGHLASVFTDHNNPQRSVTILINFQTEWKVETLNPYKKSVFSALNLKKMEKRHGFESRGNYLKMSLRFTSSKREVGEWNEKKLISPATSSINRWTIQFPFRGTWYWQLWQRTTCSKWIKLKKSVEENENVSFYLHEPQTKRKLLEIRHRVPKEID
jgi:hypothetical protein